MLLLTLFWAQVGDLAVAMTKVKNRLTLSVCLKNLNYDGGDDK
jgi:hypothetical protein